MIVCSSKVATQNNDRILTQVLKRQNPLDAHKDLRDLVNQFPRKKTGSLSIALLDEVMLNESRRYVGIAKSQSFDSSIEL